MQKQLIELQELLAYQQLSIAKMSEEMYAQQRDIAQLRQEIAQLKAHILRDAGVAQSDDIPEMPPPHY